MALRFSVQNLGFRVRLAKGPLRVDIGVTHSCSVVYTLIQSLIRNPCPFNYVGNIGDGSYEPLTSSLTCLGSLLGPRLCQSCM